MKTRHALTASVFLSLSGCFDSAGQPDEQIKQKIEKPSASSVAASDEPRNLAMKKVEAVTGKDKSSFDIQELPSDSGETRIFLFSYLNGNEMPPGTDIAVSVNITSGEVTIISD